MKALQRPRSSPGYLGFKVIGAFKLASGLLMLAVGFGLLRLVDHNQGAGWESFIKQLQLDAHSRLFRSAVAWISGMDRDHIHLIEAGTFFYAVLHLVEGTGLVLERDWAGYVVVVITGSLIPFEFYEIVRQPSAARVGILIVNAAVLVYLAVELVKERRERSRTTCDGQAPATSA